MANPDPKVFGKPYSFGPDVRPTRQGAFDFGKALVQSATKLAAEGKLKAHKQDVREGGLEAVFKGLEDLKAGKIRGAKVVVKM